MAIVNVLSEMQDTFFMTCDILNTCDVNRIITEITNFNKSSVTVLMLNNYVIIIITIIVIIFIIIIFTITIIIYK